MSEFKGTPGPWHVAGGCQIRSVRDQIAKVWMMRGGEGKANANLIAAAPELLEAMDIIVRLDENDVYVDAPWQAALKLARAAIRKALGE